MDSIIKYFDGEKLQCTIGVIIAVICIIAAVYFLFLNNPILKGVSYTFLPLSLFLVSICTGVIVRTPKDIERVTTFYNTEITNMQAVELPRMEKVMKSFKIIKIVEICLFFIGVLLAILFWKNGLLRGIAIGLMIQGFILYLFDYAAESRGEIYIDFLKSL